MRISLPTRPRRFLRWEYIPEAAVVAGLTAFLLDQTDAATSAFKSTKALAIMAATTAGWIGARLLAARLVPLAAARAAAFSVAAAVALAVVVLPAYDNETVIESFPTAAAMPVPAPPEEATAGTSAGADRAPATLAPAPTVPPTTRPPEPRPPTAASLRPSAGSTAPAPAGPPTTTTSSAAAGPPDAAPAAAAPEPAPAPTGPQRLRAGAIRGIDHRASGTAVIYRQPDGRYVVGLEDIDIQPGPDYDLYVVPGEDREGGIRLGDLRGNRGTQFYEVPDGTDLEAGPWTVLVWCQTFAVPVAGATPS